MVVEITSGERKGSEDVATMNGKGGERQIPVSTGNREDQRDHIGQSVLDVGHSTGQDSVQQMDSNEPGVIISTILPENAIIRRGRIWQPLSKKTF